MSENNLIDVWREMNAGKKDFSRRQIVGHFICKTRIYYLFIYLVI